MRLLRGFAGFIIDAAGEDCSGSRWQHPCLRLREELESRCAEFSFTAGQGTQRAES